MCNIHCACYESDVKKEKMSSKLLLLMLDNPIKIHSHAVLITSQRQQSTFRDEDVMQTDATQRQASGRKNTLS